MKNKDSIIKFASVLVVILIVVALIAKCSAGKIKEGYAVGADSVIAVGADHVYYNDGDNNIWCKNINTGEVAIFAQNITLLAADYSGVLATDGVELVIYNESGALIDSVQGVVGEYAQLTGDSIYYKHVDTGYVVKMNRETRTVEDALPIEVNKFLVREDRIIFTTKDNNMVFIYDMETGVPTGYFGDKNIGDFAVYGNELVYSDLNNGGKVYKLDVSTGSETEITGVESTRFDYRYGVLFYIENVDGGSEEYKIKSKES